MEHPLYKIILPILKFHLQGMTHANSVFQWHLLSLASMVRSTLSLHNLINNKIKNNEAVRT